MRHSLCAIAVSLSACSSKDDLRPTVSTVLRGEIHFGDAIGPWNVEVLDENGTTPQLVQQTVAEDDSFQLDLAYRAGTFLISASSADQHRASVFAEVELDTTNTVVLTPI